MSNKIRPYLKDINNLKKSDTWKIQLTIANNFIFSIRSGYKLKYRDWQKSIHFSFFMMQFFTIHLASKSQYQDIPQKKKEFFCLTEKQKLFCCYH